MVAEFRYRSEITFHPDGTVEVKTEIPGEEQLGRAANDHLVGELTGEVVGREVARHHQGVRIDDDVAGRGRLDEHGGQKERAERDQSEREGSPHGGESVAGPPRDSVVGLRSYQSPYL